MNGGDIVSLVTVFVLSAFVGFEVIAKVPSTLHTPLMSGTNAIHGVVVVGAMLILGTANGTTQMVLGFIAVVLATLNVVGGFVVTDRMLEMFKVRQPHQESDRVQRIRRAGHRERTEVSTGTGIRLGDLIAAICFILALRGLTSPKTARRGNLIGAAGMALAIGVTFATNGLTHILLIVGAMAIGAIVAVPAARLVKMTAMPQMVAAFNGVGGGAAALIALATFLRAPNGSLAVYQVVEILFGVVVGCVSFVRKLRRLREAPGADDRAARHLPGPATGERDHRRRDPRARRRGLRQPPRLDGRDSARARRCVFGVAFVLPIGGADVPVLISLLNSFTGLAVAASGFVLHSALLVVAGTLVGASGTLLTQMMSRAMGRSLPEHPVQRLRFGHHRHRRRRGRHEPQPSGPRAPRTSPSCSPTRTR